MSVVAFDTETALSIPGLAAPPLACGSFAWIGEGGSIQSEVLDASATLTEIVTLLRDSSVTIVGHNIAYDFTCVLAYAYSISRERGDEVIALVFQAYADSRIRDTDFRERLIAIAQGEFNDDRDVAYSLETLAKQRLGITLDKTTHRHGYGKLSVVPVYAWELGAVTYAREDAIVTLKVYLDQAHEADDYQTGQDDHAVWHEPHATRKAFALQLMRCHGVRVDAARVDTLHLQLLAKERMLMVELVKAGILVKHKKKDEYTAKRKVIQAHVEAAYPTGAPLTNPSSKFPTGQVKTDAETCEDSGDPVLETYSDYVGVDKVIGTFLRPLLEAGGRPINPWWNPMVSSDRTSCSGPNFQNPPRAEGVRECVIPGAGQVFSSVDYSTIELVALADFNYKTFGFSAMADRIRQGMDLHTALAARILGISYEEAKANKSRPDVKHARNLAKAIGFGYAGGLGAAKFVTMSKKGYGLIFTEDEARAYKRLYLEENPEMVRFFAHVSQMCSGGFGTVVIPGSGMIRANCTYTAAANTHFQSPVAYGATDALFYVSWECYDPTRKSILLGSRPTLFIHDEIDCAHPRAIGAECAERVRQIMVERMSLVLTDVPVAAEACLMTRWSKAAEPVFNAKGELVPWEKKPEKVTPEAVLSKAA